MIIRRQKEFNFAPQDSAYTKWLMEKGEKISEPVRDYNDFMDRKREAEAAGTKRAMVDFEQYATKKDIANKRAHAREDRAAEFKKDSSNHNVNKELGITVWNRNEDANVAAREARQAELKAAYDKNEKKIARAEKWEDRKLAAKHTLQDLDASYEDKTGRDLGKDAAIAAGVAAVGAGGYAAYKAWKKKQAKKKEAQAQAEAKFDKKEEKK